MLATGIRTPVGLKIQGGDVNQIQQVGRQVEAALASVPGTRSVFAERTGEGYFLDVSWDRDALARFGLSVEEAQNAPSTAVGGDNVGTLIEGRQRYPINVRYQRDFRSDLEALGRVLVQSSSNRQVALSELATIRMVNGPAMLRDEDGLLTEYVLVDVGGRSPGDYVAQARHELQNKLKLPTGYTVLWSGQYESAERARQRLSLAVPFSAVGAVWMVYLLGYHMSIAVWVGIIALLGIDAETGVFMLLYLDLAFAQASRGKERLTRAHLCEAIVEGGAKRLRPKLMTFAAMSTGLIPILWSSGTGSEIMKHVAAPLVGGIVTSFILELAVYPAIYALWRERSALVPDGGVEPTRCPLPSAR